MKEFSKDFFFGKIAEADISYVILNKLFYLAILTIYISYYLIDT